MNTSKLLVTVRDIKTGTILTSPPESLCWLAREKSGLGRASRNEWNVVKAVDLKLFEEMDRLRTWSFGFTDYYDILIWDLESGCPSAGLYNNVQTLLVKAHRFSTSLDLYRPTGHVLKSLYMDENTGRARDLKEGESSLWDLLAGNDPKLKIKHWEMSQSRRQSLDMGSAQSGMPSQWQYSEADRLEDEVLFPLETTIPTTEQRLEDPVAGNGETVSANVDDGKRNTISEEPDEAPANERKFHRFEGNMTYVMKRFINDLDTDKELDPDCTSDCDLECEHTFRSAKKQEEADDIDPDLISADDAETSSHEWTDELESDDEATVDDEGDFDDVEIISAVSKHSQSIDLDRSAREAKTSTTKQQSANSPSDLLPSGIRADIRPKLKSTGNRAIAKRSKRRRPSKTKPTKSAKPTLRSSEVPKMKEEFDLYLDRERAAAFKDSWHRADLEPGAQKRWSEYADLSAAVKGWLNNQQRGRAFGRFNKQCVRADQLLEELEVPEDCHFKIVRDMHSAYELVSIMFGRYDAFFDSDLGSPFKNSLLLDQAERAKQIPDKRSSHSNKTRPKEHFKDYDDIHKHFHGRHVTLDNYPDRYNTTVRPAIAHLYREGVICSSFNSFAGGVAIALTEPDRPGKPDLYFDWRHGNQEARMAPYLRDPFAVEPLLSQARRFAAAHPATKEGAGPVFSLLRVWSAPHFWPLMLGHDSRDNTSFADGMERFWEWKFIPKNMPYSEWSIHQSVRMRIEPYEMVFRKRVVPRMDVLLVMGENREMCRKLTTAAVWAVQTRPWRLEVDPWKSFMGVDLGFLEGLDKKWWV